MLELKNLYKRYQRKDAWAVNNVSLQVPAGELLALVGESGSGKTTLLRLIAGFEVPEKGTIYLNGRTVWGPATYVQPEQRRIGMVFQDYALFPHLTIKENILFGLKKASRQQKESRLQELLQLVGLEAHALKYPHELSGGQQQRVALARALAPQPDILLLDEPFSNLDEVLKEQMRREVRRIIKESGLTAIFVTHDTRDALTTADRIIILKNGSIDQTGTPQQVYEQPANAYVAGFFGQVNLIPATRTSEGYHTALGFIKNTSPGHNSSAAEVLLSVRPEQLLVSTKEAALFSGTVREVSYLGSYVNVRLSTAAGLLLLQLPVEQAPAEEDILFCRVNRTSINEIARNR